jgi:hypothetical protein
MYIQVLFPVACCVNNFPTKINDGCLLATNENRIFEQRNS